MKYCLLILACIALPRASFAAPTASQTIQVVGSPSRPHLELKIDSAFSPMAPMLFRLEFTDVDRRIFVDADQSRTVRRIVVIQFERVRKGAHFKFVYRPRPPIVFGKETYRFGAYVYDDAKAAASQPNMEAARTRAALEGRRYRLPRFLRTARLARVADPQGQSEVIIFYFENADATYPTGILPNADAGGDLVLDSTDAKLLFDRMKSFVHALAG